MGMNVAYIPCAPEWCAVFRNPDDASVIHEHSVAFWQYLPDGTVRAFCPTYGDPGGSFVGPDTPDFKCFSLELT